MLDSGTKTGRRAVLATGWGGLAPGEVPGNIFVAPDVPHQLVLPRTSVVVHHDGAGTTAAAVAAGRPQVICPFVADQPFWGRRMAQLGVAPSPISQRRLTAAKLADAIDHAAGFAAAAAELGSRVRAEQGVHEAVRQLVR